MTANKNDSGKGLGTILIVYRKGDLFLGRGPKDTLIMGVSLSLGPKKLEQVLRGHNLDSILFYDNTSIADFTPDIQILLHRCLRNKRVGLSA